MRVITVDFDGTLYQGNSFKVMFDVAKKEFKFKQWLVVGSSILKALIALATSGKEKAKHTFFRGFVKSFKGKSHQELKGFFDQLAGGDLEKVNRPLVEKVKKHQSEGDRILIVSGALMPFLNAFTEVIELTDVDIIGTELKYDGQGYCTGRMGEIVNGDRKAVVVRNWLSSQNVADVDVTLWAYADSKSDEPLLEMVDYPVVVNPDENMEKLAQQKGWPVFGN
ncbi:HAD-IB family hydrolase [Halalkalibacillus sediminis]|uniref:HAD-IB family hydrolase n=1 Tax=Halalkalibacillus sediminis TaxID=2018042 RepID=A0A2I0QWR7_9BACI|nr:HAD-IB family phosphatase [Halalkalibacillus sediminis]PKR78764.1 HAD-IB family hydrolase [Halalkalibacillus sediminis]